MVWKFSGKISLPFYLILVFVAAVANGFSLTHIDAELPRTYSTFSSTLWAKLGEIPLKANISEILTENKFATKYMLTLFQNLLDGIPFDRSAQVARRSKHLESVDTVRSFSSKISDKAGRTIKFEIPPLPVNEILKQTEIRFKADSIENAQRSTVKGLVIKQNGVFLRELVVRAKTTLLGDHLVLDITELLRPWINGYNGNITIEISGTFKMKDTSERILSDKQQRDNSCPILVLFLQNSQFMRDLHKSGAVSFSSKTEPVSKSRSKRYAKRMIRDKNKNVLSNKTRRRKRKLCQILDFQVDFNAIGWGRYIIFPKSYNAKMCKGSCPSPIRNDLLPSNHAMLQSLMRLGNKKAIPMPCCVPTKLEPLSMLYYENDEIVVRHHADMIAAECGCR